MSIIADFYKVYRYENEFTVTHDYTLISYSVYMVYLLYVEDLLMRTGAYYEIRI